MERRRDAGGVVLVLNGHNLTLCDIAADDYLGTVITNSAVRKSVLFFTGEPLESRAYTEGVVKEAGTKVVLAKVGEQAAFWTGAAGDGSVANAGNWEDVLTGEGVVPTADYDVTISGTAVNLQVPANASLAYKSLTVLSCTLAANCDWTGLGTITLEPGSTTAEFTIGESGTGAYNLSGGTVALSAACDNSKVAAALAHRWSFNGADEAANLTDSVGGVTGSKIGTAVAFADGQVAFAGNGNGKGALNLGKGILGIGDATIEIWATRTAIRKWGRVFDYGASTANWITMAWNISTDNNRCKVGMCKSTQDYTDYSGFSLGSGGNESYIAVRLHAKADDGTLLLDWREYDSATQALLHSGSITNSHGLTLEYLYNDKANFYLGHSLYTADYDAHAKFNEVRIWKGALSDDAIALSAAKGPDATAADIAEIVAATSAASPAVRTLKLESGSSLSVASGVTLTQPIVKGTGTIATGAGGSLVVSDKIVANVGDYIEASGTIDLSNAKIELADPENLATPFTFLKPAVGQTLTVIGEPTPTNLPKGWKVSVSANGTCRIGKMGFMIIFK